jgi:hypothetical protein
LFLAYNFFKSCQKTNKIKQLSVSFFNSNSNWGSHTNHGVVTGAESAEKSYKAPIRETMPTSVYDCAVLPCHLVLYMEGITVLMKGVPLYVLAP